MQIRTCLISLLLPLVAACGPTAGGPVEWGLHPAAEERLVHLEIASPQDRGRLEGAWSRGEKKGPRGYRWLKGMEGHVRFEWTGADPDEPLVCWMIAAPLYIDWKQQRIALYVNGRYAAEWTCPLSYHFNLYRAEVPGALFQVGENTLTLRAGYCRRLPGDSRRLSFALDKVMITAASDS